MSTLIGWPAVILSLVIAAGGIYSRRPWLLVVSGILIVPISWYLGGTPALRTIGFFAPLFPWAAAIMLWKDRRRLAMVAMVPVVLVFVWLAYVALVV